MVKETCCFTGHRAQKLPWGFNENDKRCIKMKKKLKKIIITAIKNGYRDFITGMALGFDIICAEMILYLKTFFPHIKLIGALPCINQEKLWQPKDKERYHQILARLDEIHIISRQYTGKICMIKRNIFMLNNSSLVIALFNGQPGGTAQTLAYAKTHSIKCITITP